MRIIATATLAVLLAPHVGASIELKVRSSQPICRATTGNLRVMAATAEAMEKKDGQFVVVALMAMVASTECISLKEGDAMTVLDKPHQRPEKGVVTVCREGEVSLFSASRSPNSYWGTYVYNFYSFSATFAINIGMFSPSESITAWAVSYVLLG